MTVSEPAFARPGIDRAGAERDVDGIVDALRADPSTRVVAIRGDAVPIAPGPSILHLRADQVSADATWVLLGRDGDGAGVLAAVVSDDAEVVVPADASWGTLREVGGDLDERDAGVFVEALSLARWVRDAGYCPFCGAEAHLGQAGWSRVCSGCGRQHFPRTDPAVIVAVTSEDTERLLLGSNALWGAGRYSCFAGFVEAGESLESAVAREIEEESGIVVADVRYRASQAWPYPRSIMLGFHATATSDAAARADGEEIVEVRWFTRDEIGAAFDGDSDITLPGNASIAYRLIRDWFEGRA